MPLELTDGTRVMGGGLARASPEHRLTGAELLRCHNVDYQLAKEGCCAKGLDSVALRFHSNPLMSNPELVPLHLVNVHGQPLLIVARIDPHFHWLSGPIKAVYAYIFSKNDYNQYGWYALDYLSVIPRDVVVSLPFRHHQDEDDPERTTTYVYMVGHSLTAHPTSQVIALHEASDGTIEWELLCSQYSNDDYRMGLGIANLNLKYNVWVGVETSGSNFPSTHYWCYRFQLIDHCGLGEDLKEGNVTSRDGMFQPSNAEEYSPPSDAGSLTLHFNRLDLSALKKRFAYIRIWRTRGYTDEGHFTQLGPDSFYHVGDFDLNAKPKYGYPTDYFVDDVADLDMYKTLSDDGNGNCRDIPPDVESMCDHNGRLFALKGNKIHMSRANRHLNFQDDLFLELPTHSDGVKIVSTGNRIVVFTEDEIWGLKGSSYADFSRPLKLGQYGLRKKMHTHNPKVHDYHDPVVVYGDYVIFVEKNGKVVFVGPERVEKIEKGMNIGAPVLAATRIGEHIYFSNPNWTYDYHTGTGTWATRSFKTLVWMKPMPSAMIVEPTSPQSGGGVPPYSDWCERWYGKAPVWFKVCMAQTFEKEIEAFFYKYKDAAWVEMANWTELNPQTPQPALRLLPKHLRDETTIEMEGTGFHIGEDGSLRIFWPNPFLEMDVKTKPFDWGKEDSDKWFKEVRICYRQDFNQLAFLAGCIDPMEPKMVRDNIVVELYKDDDAEPFHSKPLTLKAAVALDNPVFMKSIGAMIRAKKVTVRIRHEWGLTFQPLAVILERYKTAGDKVLVPSTVPAEAGGAPA